MADDLTPQQKAEHLFEMKRREAERQHDRIDKSVARTNESSVSSGMVAIRGFLLINGGAAVSVLAFIGGLVGHDNVTVKQLAEISGSLLWFGGGVALAAAALALSYATNYGHLALTQSLIRTWEHPYHQDGPRSKRLRWSSNIVHILTVVAAVLALITFIVGMIDVRAAIVRLGTRGP